VRRLASALLLAAAAAVLIAGCNTKNDERHGTVNAKVDTIGGFILSWQPDSGFLRVRVSAPTTGWVAVGFNTLPQMLGANLIIGYVHGDTVRIEDDFGMDAHTHMADIAGEGFDNVGQRSGSESGGRTEIAFIIPLDSGDPRDVPLVVGQSYSLLLSCGADGADDFVSYHSFRVTATITI